MSAINEVSTDLQNGYTQERRVIERIWKLLQNGV